MSSVGDAIFLMDDEVINDINVIERRKSTETVKIKKNKKLEENINIVIAKSPPIDIIKTPIENKIIDNIASSP
jgi:hypothetical protein